jgi:phage repressor protein C with HTH and peptisase S24 domain
VGRLQTILAQWPSADRLARSMGVSPSAFRKWLKGEAEPSRERLVALARTSGVSVAWLAEGEGPEPNFEASSPGRRQPNVSPSAGTFDTTQFVLLPRKSAPAGEAEASLSEFLALHQDWVRSVCGVEPDNLLLETASGESMDPTIRNGNIMLVDTADRDCRSLGIYLLEVGGDRLVRRVQRKHDGSLTLISDNATYEHDTLNKESAEVTEVIGRVVWSGGLL